MLNLNSLKRTFHFGSNLQLPSNKSLVVDDKIPSKTLSINYKIFALLIGLSLAYQGYISIYDDTPGLDFPEFSYIIGATICGIVAIVVGRKYRSNETFRTSYISLGIYFFLLAFGEIIYIAYYHVLKIDAYPSMADVFYLTASLFAFIHLIININYFKKKISNKTKVILPVIGIIILLTYAVFSFNQIGEANLDFFTGLLYASTYSILFPLAVLGIIVSRKTPLAATWLLLVIGIFLLGLGQVWWIFLEFFEGFSYRHPVTALWLLGFMVMAFALIEHLRVGSKIK